MHTLQLPRCSTHVVHKDLLSSIASDYVSGMHIKKAAPAVLLTHVPSVPAAHSSQSPTPAARSGQYNTISYMLRAETRPQQSQQADSPTPAACSSHSATLRVADSAHDACTHV
jgi:hypothetical protein